MGGPPISTWSTPSCFTRRIPASLRPPAASPPAPISRHSLGVSAASPCRLAPPDSPAITTDQAVTPAALISALRDKSAFTRRLCTVRPPFAESPIPVALRPRDVAAGHHVNLQLGVGGRHVGRRKTKLAADDVGSLREIG